MKVTKTRLENVGEKDFVESAKDVNMSTEEEKVEEEKVEETPEGFKILLGSWVAQWDPQYAAWFYYNIETGVTSLCLFP